MPNRPLPKSIISPYMTSARPWMRTMPSETETIVPSLRASDEVSRLAMRCLMISLISAGFSCCMVGSSGIQGARQLVQPAAHGSVDNQVAEADDNAAHQRRIHIDGNAHVLRKTTLQRSGELRCFSVAHCVGGSDGDFAKLLEFSNHEIELFADGGQREDAAIAAQLPYKVL